MSLWRAPSEGTEDRVPRGAGAAGKVEAEHRPVPTVLLGVGRVCGGRGDVGVRELEFVCVRALLCLREGARFQSTDLGPE